MLERRFLSLLENIGASKNQAKKAWLQLYELYQAEGRPYHNLSHISFMLELMDEYVEEDKRSVTLELAIWYHDIIYDAKSRENEKKSAELCKHSLKDISNLSPEEIEEIYLLIMSTLGHSPRLEGETNLWLLDMDLSILGADEKLYDLYSQHIRVEYQHYPEADYRQGRAQVLKSFLERENIYFSPLFQKLFEEKARQNLKREIESLLSKN